MNSRQPLLLRMAAVAARILPSQAMAILYRLGPGSSFVRKLLNRSAPAEHSEVIVAGGPLAGMRLVLDLQREKNLWLGTFEPEMLAAIAELCRPDMVVYDLGAKIGYLSVAMARATAPQGQVFAFEPLPANQDRLLRNLALNGLESRVTLIEAAVGERAERRRFLVHASPGMGKLEGSQGRQEIYQDTLEVEVIDLDHFVFQGGHPIPSVIKIDVEGGEGLALRGMQRLLREGKPILMLELHGPEATHTCWDILRAAGYRMRQLDRRQGWIESPDEIGWKSYLLALPESSVLRTGIGDA